MLISGEPGIGKSRLTAALSRAHRKPSRIPACAISARRITRTARSIPFIAQLERAAGFARDDTPEAKLGQAARRCSRRRRAAGRGCRAARRAAVVAGGRAPRAARTSARSARRRGLFEALLRQLEGLARQQPVLMVFEDAHWIDPTSRELLDLDRRAGAAVCRCCWSSPSAPSSSRPGPASRT